MKQIIQSYKTGQMSLDDVPEPQTAGGMVLVDTRASVVSAGTEKMLVELAKRSLLGKARARPDLARKVIDTAKREGFSNAFRKVRSKLENPIPLGYSCAGVVREVADGVDEFLPGDVVACAGVGYANHAECNVVPKNLCVRIPERRSEHGSISPVSFEEAAFATVGAIALQGVRQAGLTLGERVCVIGLGLLGQLTVQLCKANGCRVIGADIDARKIEMAAGFGADAAVHSKDLESAIWQFSGGVGADAVIIAAAARGSELVALAGEISRLKGRVVAVGLVGLEIPRDIYYKKELDLRLSMSYGPGRYDAEYEERGHDYPLSYVRWTEQRNMQAFLELVAAGRVDVKSLISHRYPFDQALSAYEMITSGKEASLGVVLEYGSGSVASKTPVAGRAAPCLERLVSLGVVGGGNFAKAVLLPAFSGHKLVKFQGVATAKGVSAKAVRDRFGFSYCAENIDEILADDSINCVLVATRHNLHGPLVAKVLSVGKHVFVEKPLCLNPAELSVIVERYGTCAKGEKTPVLMVGFNRRFSPFVQRSRSLLENRNTPLVASYRINAGFIPKDSWVQDPVEGGGRIIGEVCHFVDTLRFLVGSPVRTVQAACIKSGDTRLTNRDSVAVILTYDDGSIGTILYHAVGSPRYPKEKLEIAADGKIIVLDDFCRLEVFGRKKESIKSKQDKGFESEVKAFINAVVNGGAAPIPFAEIAETTRVTFAIHEALNTGRTIYLDG